MYDEYEIFASCYLHRSGLIVMLLVGLFGCIWMNSTLATSVEQGCRVKFGVACLYFRARNLFFYVNCISVTIFVVKDLCKRSLKKWSTSLGLEVLMSCF